MERYAIRVKLDFLPWVLGIVAVHSYFLNTYFLYVAFYNLWTFKFKNY